MSRPPATPTVQLDNDLVRVTEWRFPPGSETGWHRHAMHYVVVPVTNGELLLQTPEGERRSPLVLGQSYTRTEGTEHNVINPSDTEEVAFVEIEMKTADWVACCGPDGKFNIPGFGPQYR